MTRKVSASYLPGTDKSDVDVAENTSKIHATYAQG